MVWNTLSAPPNANSAPENNSIPFCLDMALCLGGIAQFDPAIVRLEAKARRFHRSVERAIRARGGHLEDLRARLVSSVGSPGVPLALSNIADLGIAEVMESKPGDTLAGALPDDNVDDALEAIVQAIRGPWTQGGGNRRHIVLLSTNACDGPGSPLAASKTPRSRLDEVREIWDSAMDIAARRLIIFAPPGEPWSEIPESWDSVLYVSSPVANGVWTAGWNDIAGSIAMELRPSSADVSRVLSNGDLADNLADFPEREEGLDARSRGLWERSAFDTTPSLAQKRAAPGRICKSTNLE